MPTRPLPDNPSLESLRKQAKALRRDLRTGSSDTARALLSEFDPVAAESGTELTLAGAQLVIARSYGFPSWPRLHEHVQLRQQYTRFPEPLGELSATPGPDDLLQLACLNYTHDSEAAFVRARRLLVTTPELALAGVHTMAATGAVAEITALLADDPTAARRSGGPFDWEPLGYLCYSRIGDIGQGRSALGTARALLAAGADPNTGFLWQGMPSPFTALTAALGGGEQNQPPHHDAIALARLLLEAGADPNDNQALYNRMFTPEDDHLELLFEYGLGTDVPGPWRERLGEAYPSATQMVQEQLRWAAHRDMPDRIRLLLAHGVDPDGLGYHPNFGSRTPYELALLGGNKECAALLAEAGARSDGIDSAAEFLGACLAGDTERADQLAADADRVARAIDRIPDAVAQAVRAGRPEAVRLTIRYGFDVNADGNSGRTSHPGRTALHEAAAAGDPTLVDDLLAHGADPTALDRSHHQTPAGWAAHYGHHDLAARLRDLE